MSTKPMSTKRTLISNPDWLVAWDESEQRHVYRRGCDVVFDGAAIVHLGPCHSAEADERIDGRGLLVMPGLVNLHSHPTTEPAQRGIREEHGVPEMFMSSLYQRSVVFRLDEDGRRAATEVAYAEMLRSGVTTVVDLSFPFPGWLEIAARSGLRAVLGPGFASARWTLERDRELGFDWDEAEGRRGLAAALALIERARQDASGRLDGILYPAQIDTCTPELLVESVAAARERSLPLTTHAAQSVVEFNEMVKRHGETPIQWAARIGLLGPHTTLAHAIFIDEHSWVRWSTRRDLGLIAETGTHVAHCPTPFSRYGQMLESFGRYRRAGVNLGVGTDCAPHNLLEEMRTALILSRIAARDIHDVATSHLLDAATVGGARALGRDDIGRIAPGCKADLVLIDLERPSMRPVRDPLRSLVYSGADRAVRDVYVDGEPVVREGRVLTLDEDEASAHLREAQARMLTGVPDRDWRSRSAGQISPLSLPIRT